jgi:gliding motility-associated-like protein
VFKGYGLYLTEFNLEIFNAWGNLIWVGQSLKEGWNGEISGQPAPSGPYAYKARGKDEQGASYQSTGYFNLVR